MDNDYAILMRLAIEKANERKRLQEAELAEKKRGMVHDRPRNEGPLTRGQQLLRQGWTPEAAYADEARDIPLGQQLGSILGTWIEERTPMELVAMSPIPGVSDLAGAKVDYDFYQENPEQLTPFNAAMSALGLLPFVPGVAGVVGSEASQLGRIGAARPKEPITQLEPGVQTGQRVSTATPTAIEAEKIGLHDNDRYLIQGDTMRSNPKAFEHNMELMSHYMPSKAKSAESRFRSYRNIMASNLSFLANQAPESFLLRSGNWYKGANALANDMANAFGVPIEAAAGVLARLSPGMDWFQNVEQADRLIDIWRNNKHTVMPKNGSRFVGKTLDQMTSSIDKADWIRAYDEATNVLHFHRLSPEGALKGLDRTKKGEPKKFMWQSNKNLSLAIDMLENPTTDNISRKLGLGGHKIRNFYNNIVDPFSPLDLTVDTHAVSGSLLTPFSQESIPVRHSFGGGSVKGGPAGTAKSGMAHGTYGLHSDAYKQAAAEISVLPQALQSPIWELVRENFPTHAKQKAALRAQIQPILEDWGRGRISGDHARALILETATGGTGIKLPDWGD